ncbi:hypothetical protein GLYMA_09G188400v4 [Glycine max]|uniref:Transmembrane protein n=1 Tax=Glycine max TaxID=3847 RepID=K7LER3_SOYBN|nr:hypothetical protein JHK86_025685 [Glycine max]KAH1043682.1 hypothetical protein GYH30_025503 [Glycine max]KRH39256.1 hypothetical protein GLYMA_09G188400v4 [Glycine max]
MKGVQRTIRGDIIFSFFFVGASMCCSFVICSIDWLVVFASLVPPTCVIFIFFGFTILYDFVILQFW